MAPNKKQKVIKLGNTARIFLVVFLVIFLISFLLRFDVIAEALAKFLPWTKEEIQNTGGDALLIASGFILVIAGIVFMSIPVVGVLLVLAGAAFLVIAVINAWNIFKPDKPITGLKTFNT